MNIKFACVDTNEKRVIRVKKVDGENHIVDDLFKKEDSKIYDYDKIMKTLNTLVDDKDSPLSHREIEIFQDFLYREHERVNKEKIFYSVPSGVHTFSMDAVTRGTIEKEKTFDGKIERNPDRRKLGFHNYKTDEGCFPATVICIYGYPLFVDDSHINRLEFEYEFKRLTDALPSVDYACGVKVRFLDEGYEFNFNNDEHVVVLDKDDANFVDSYLAACVARESQPGPIMFHEAQAVPEFQEQGTQTNE